eukprot:s774_g3.t1
MQLPELAEQAPAHEIASAALETKHQQKQQQKAAETTADATANAAYGLCPKARPKPEAGTGTDCSVNAQEQDKQHIESQKQLPELAEQAPAHPAHEIASAALETKHQQKQQQKQQQTQQQMLHMAYAPKPGPKPEAGTGTDCSLNAQEQDKQHIESQKQLPELAEQSPAHPAHEIASAALETKHQQKQQQKQQQTQQQMLRGLCPKAGPKPEAGTGTDCYSNAQEQDKQHIELQKQFPELAEQAPAHPAHEIASAALETKHQHKRRQKQQQKQLQKQQQTQQQMLHMAYAPKPGPNSKQELAPTAV